MNSIFKKIAVTLGTVVVAPAVLAAKSAYERGKQAQAEEDKKLLQKEVARMRAANMEVKVVEVSSGASSTTKASD